MSNLYKMGFAGALGALAVALGAIAAPREALAAWLVAAVSVTAIPAGALPLLLVWHLHRGAWGFVTGRAMEAAVATMPAAALVMLPVIVFPEALYPWAWREGEHISSWLQPGQFIGRGVIYFAAWCILAYLATGRRRTGDDWRPRPALASVGLIVYALTASFAGIDWILSLQPTVYSSIFGLIFTSHQMLGAFAFLVLMSISAHEVSVKHVRGLANMLAGGLMLWIYFEYIQYLIAWSGDLPGHTKFYLDRTGGGWTAVIYFLSIFGAAVPFVLLMWERIRESARLVAAVAALFLLTRVVEACWWVMPLFRPGAALPLLVVASLLGAGGMWGAVWLWQYERRAAPSYPVGHKGEAHV